ncbi:MAG: hypothetical protein LBL99_02030, partial [Holosporaceae bacterium]|nr:hypothetical protein [Holosporaceae bacterium]
AQKINAQELAKMYGIDQKYVDEIEINIADKEKEIVEKLYSKQAETLSKKAIKIRKLEGKLDSINPTDTDYEEKLNKLTEERLQLTEEQDREELSKYVIRRDFVVKLLQKILSERQIKEEVIQNLFFKRKSTAKTSDLWIFDEEFVHFEGYADNDLSRLEVDGEKLLRDSVDIETVLKSVGIEMGNALKWRPDIFLYPEEGKCILFEFKAPEVEVSKHCDQIQKYAKIIANYSKKEFRQFYGFLIGQQINPLAIPDRYKKAPCGSYWYYPSEPINNIATGVPIADIYQEIIPLSEIAKRAEIRNRSFAEKLGLSDQA